MATATKRRKGIHSPIGELSGVTITRKMLKSGESSTKAIAEFLRFCEAMNRGQI